MPNAPVNQISDKEVIEHMLACEVAIEHLGSRKSFSEKEEQLIRQLRDENLRIKNNIFGDDNLKLSPKPAFVNALDAVQMAFDKMLPYKSLTNRF
jgi:hypothetical protein